MLVGVSTSIADDVIFGGLNAGRTGNAQYYYRRYARDRIVKKWVSGPGLPVPSG